VFQLITIQVLTKDIQIYEKKSTLPKDFNYNLM
jgi:hypothetical protein